jgi:signal peptidase II
MRVPPVSTGVRVAFLALVMASTIGCDRVTKHAAAELLAHRPTQSFLADSLRLTYAENTGGFLSLGAALPPVVRTTVFTVSTGLVLVVLLVELLRSNWPFWRATGTALFIAGGVSNWIDRALWGSVVDFLNVGIGWLRTGIFNFADVAIMLGIALFVLSELSARRKPDAGGIRG